MGTPARVRISPLAHRVGLTLHTSAVAGPNSHALAIPALQTRRRALVQALSFLPFGVVCVCASPFAA